MIQGGPATVSTGQLLALEYPPTTIPRARIFTFAAKESPPSCHPPVIRVPAPTPNQLVPSVEISKLVRDSSGLAPPRSHVIVEQSKLRDWVAASVLLSRPMRSEERRVGKECRSR